MAKVANKTPAVAENGQHDLTAEDPDVLKHYYYQMLLLRRFEERAREMYTRPRSAATVT